LKMCSSAAFFYAHVGDADLVHQLSVFGHERVI